MDKTITNDYLEDIRPTMTRIKQLEYLLSIPVDHDNMRAVSYGDKVATYTTGDSTASAVITALDRQQDQRQELATLKCKLDLYTHWLSHLSERQLDLATAIYVDGHSTGWIAYNKSYEPSSIRAGKARILEKLSEIEILAITEKEKGR